MKRLHHASAQLIFSSLALALISLSVSLTINAQQTPGIVGKTSSPRPDPDSVVLTVTVMDKKGGYISGLEKGYFTVFDNKLPQDITFFDGQDKPVSVGIVFDASKSMDARGSKFSRIREALSRFMQQSHGENDYFLIGFNESPQLLVDWTRDGQKILYKLASIEPKLDTALFDACYLAVEKIMRASHAKRVLLLISDGQDNMSRFTFRELEKLLKESDVLLYSIGILSSDRDSSLAMEGQAVLKDLSSINGGEFHLPDSSAEMNALFERIAFELRNQYTVGFKPADNARDGKWRKVKVKITLPSGVAPPDLKIGEVRAREGYYATKNPH